MKECSLCNWRDYDGDWGGTRCLKTVHTVCPECGKHFSGKMSDPAIPEPRLVERLKRRNETRWDKIKRFFKI